MYHESVSSQTSLLSVNLLSYLTLILGSFTKEQCMHSCWTWAPVCALEMNHLLWNQILELILLFLKREYVWSWRREQRTQRKFKSLKILYQLPNWMPLFSKIWVLVVKLWRTCQHRKVEQSSLWDLGILLMEPTKWNRIVCYGVYISCFSVEFGLQLSQSNDNSMVAALAK